MGNDYHRSEVNKISNLEVHEGLDAWYAWKGGGHCTMAANLAQSSPLKTVLNTVRTGSLDPLCRSWRAHSKVTLGSEVLRVLQCDWRDVRWSARPCQTTDSTLCSGT